MANSFPSTPTLTYPIIVSDLARASLESTIDDTAIAFIGYNNDAADAFANFPSAGDDDNVFVVKIENEKILCYGRSSGNFTVYVENTHGLGYLSGGQNGRGYDGTDAATHSADTVIYGYAESVAINNLKIAISNLEANKPDNSEVMLISGSNAMAGTLDMDGNDIDNTDVLWLGERGSNPTGVSGKGALFTRDIDGYPDLHYTDDTDQTTRITSGGQLNTAGALSFLGDGSDGAINISSGTTNLASDTFHQFTSVTVTGSGKISTNSTSGVIQIAIQGNLTVSASYGIDFSGKNPSQTDITYTLLGGDTLAYEGPANGGAGGAGQTNGGATGGSGGAQGSGYGGGGGGGGRDEVATHNGANGGAGGSPVGTGGTGGNAGNDDAGAGSNSSGGGGASSSGTAGGDGGGGTYGDNGDTSSAGGGGGCGGEIGKSALVTVINVGGNANFTGGGINNSGGAGGTGGNGGTASGGDGGGGGGGGGGSSSDVLIRHVGTFTGGTDDFTAGSGGSGGTSAGGTNGSNGSNGRANGNLTTKQIVPII